MANRTDATFIRVSGSELVQKCDDRRRPLRTASGRGSGSRVIFFLVGWRPRERGGADARRYVGEGARMVRELFELARTKKACIIFFDEVDAIGGTRFDDGAGGDNEVQRTMLELINQLDGFDPRGNIKVLMATNRCVASSVRIPPPAAHGSRRWIMSRVCMGRADRTPSRRPDTLDPALVRPGRLDRRVEFGLPDLEASERARSPPPKKSLRSAAHRLMRWERRRGWRWWRRRRVCACAGSCTHFANPHAEHER